MLKKLLYLKLLIFILLLMNSCVPQSDFGLHVLEEPVFDDCLREGDSLYDVGDREYSGDPEYGQPCNDLSEYEGGSEDNGILDIVHESDASIESQIGNVTAAETHFDTDDKTMIPDIAAATAGDESDFSNFIDTGKEEEGEGSPQNLNTASNTGGSSGDSGSGGSNELSSGDVSTTAGGESGGGSGGGSDSTNTSSSSGDDSQSSSYAATAGSGRSTGRGKGQSSLKATHSSSASTGSKSSDTQDFDDTRKKVDSGEKVTIDADPKNYFDLISIDESIFKVVERRYKNKSLKWSVEKAQELLRKAK